MLHRTSLHLRNEIFAPLLYRARAALNWSKQRVDSRDETLLSDLRHNAITVSAVDWFSPGFAVEMRRAADAVIAQMPGRSGLSLTQNPLFVRSSDLHCLSADPPQLAVLAPELLLFGLNERLLGLAAAYLRVPVALCSVHLRRDIGTGAQVGTRLWHLDTEDVRVLRLLVYLTDVSLDTGPFEFIPKCYAPRLRDLRVRALQSAGHDPITDEELAEHVSETHWAQVLGPAGTLLLADTATLFHHGKVHRSERISVIYTYTTRHPHWPRLVRNPRFDHVLNAYQRSCFFVNTSS
jgi:hypothetical protein